MALGCFFRLGFCSSELIDPWGWRTQPPVSSNAGDVDGANETHNGVTDVVSGAGGEGGQGGNATMQRQKSRTKLATGVKLNLEFGQHCHVVAHLADESGFPGRRQSLKKKGGGGHSMLRNAALTCSQVGTW